MLESEDVLCTQSSNSSRDPTASGDSFRIVTENSFESAEEYPSFIPTEATDSEDSKFDKSSNGQYKIEDNIESQIIKYDSHSRKEKLMKRITNRNISL